jgi:hypothetical protein
MAKPTADEIKTNIQAQDGEVWNQTDERPVGLDMFEADLAKAIAATWAEVEDGFVIASVPVTGGSSSPGGPLAGGMAPLSAGMLTNTKSFTAVISKFSPSPPHEATEGIMALVDAVAQGIGQGFTLWAQGYSANLTAVGGTCAWVAPDPPVNPTGASGPWSGGSIQAFPLASGSSSEDFGMTASSLETAIRNAADPEKLKQNQNRLQPALSALINAIAAGFETTWNQWKTATMISGGNGSGTATPSSGGISSGAVASPKIG